MSEMYNVNSGFHFLLQIFIKFIQMLRMLDLIRLLGSFRFHEVLLNEYLGIDIKWGHW